MILVPYDGSADAQAAIDQVAQLMPGAEATVVTVWEPFIDMLLRNGSGGMGMAPGQAGNYAEAEKIDAGNRDAAQAHAVEGAKRATAMGLIAEARCESRHGSVGNTILVTAEELDTDLVVMGTRGRSGFKSFLLGSVSHDVIQHADRAVLVVPSPTLAGQRHDHIDRDALPA